MRLVSVVVALTFTLSLAGTGFASPRVSSSTDDPSAVTAEAPESQTDVPGDSEGKPRDKEPDESVEAPPTTTQPDPGSEQGDSSDSHAAPEVEKEEPPADEAEEPSAEAPESGGKEKVASEEAAPAKAEKPGREATGDKAAAAVEEPREEAAQDSEPVKPAEKPAGESGAKGRIAIASSVVPVEVPGNAPDDGFKVEPPNSGTYVFVSGSVTATITVNVYTTAMGQEFDFTSTWPIAKVVVKGGPNHNLYTYPVPVLSDTGLHAPFNEGSEEWYDLSHFDFYLSSPASLRVYKFHDLNSNGIHDPGEPYKNGWEILLKQGATVVGSDTTDDGYVDFTGLAPGAYTVAETVQEGWTPTNLTYPVPVTLTSGGQEVVKLGNKLIDHTKTWSLSIDALPVGAEPFVRYSIDGAPMVKTALTGSGPYTAQIDVPHGSVISSIGWYVSWGGEDILLGTSDSETITADKTNSFTYNSSISGRKFDSATEDGLSGWTIMLVRIVEEVETVYGSTVTGQGGAYSFADVLPGTYRVYEVQQGGWLNTVAPEGTFVVENGSVITGKDFGNLFVNASILVEKTGVDVAHVGDVIPYAITVTNTGATLLTDVIVTDALLGVNENIGSLAPGASYTLNLTYTVLASDPDPLPNTALAVGTTVLGGTVTDDDDHLVDIVHPAIQVVKSVAPAAIILGESVTYTYVVSNTGDVVLFGVTLTDDVLGPVGTVAVLPVGGSATFTLTAAPTENTTNVVVATGSDEWGHEVSDTDDAFVEVALPFTGSPDMSIDKSADHTTVDPGDTVTYTLTLDNVGEEDAYDVVVTDDFDERYVTVIDAGGGTVGEGTIVWEIDGPLTPGEGPWEITYKVRIDSDLPESVTHIDNVAVVRTPGDENPDNDRDTWRVTSEPFAPYTEEEEESLPFTGGQWALIALSAMALAAAGEILRRMSREPVS
jgi:uncharacterized repeat protein (TIGR01451 family)